MAPYLSTATNGTFLTDFDDTLPDGTPIYNAVDPLTRPSGTTPNPDLAFERLAAQPEVIAFFDDLYGPYQYEAAGGIMDCAEVGYALESQTKAKLQPGLLGLHGRPRDRASVVRQLGDALLVAGHLAERGLCHLVAVDLRRAPRRPERPGDLRRAVRRAADASLWSRPRRRCRDPRCSSARWSTTVVR